MIFGAQDKGDQRTWSSKQKWIKVKALHVQSFAKDWRAKDWRIFWKFSKFSKLQNFLVEIPHFWSVLISTKNHGKPDMTVSKSRTRTWRRQITDTGVTNVNFWTKKFRKNAVKNCHAKDWRIFQVLSTIKMRQSLAKDCI